MAGTPMPDHDRNIRDGISLVDQIPLETAELRQLWENEGVGPEEITRRSDHYKQVRLALLQPLAGVSLMDFPSHEEVPVDLPENPLGDDYPSEIADYVEAARLHAAGKTEQSRALWKNILDRPIEEKKFRSIWSAWMLAKTSSDLTECLDWYARVEEEAKLGGTDVLGLRAAAMAWRAPRIKDPVESIRLLYEAFAAGREVAAIDLRQATSFLISSKDPAVLAAAAADPLVRTLVNMDLHAWLDDRGQVLIESNSEGSKYAAWFAALEMQADGAGEGASRVAWALYSSGNYDDSRRWLALAEREDPLALWLQAKFDLRDGNTDSAARNLATAIRIRSGQPDWNPSNNHIEELWYDGARVIQDQRDGRLLAEDGILSLARENYVASLDSLRKAGYWEDAAYVAENVVSIRELVKYVRETVPAWEIEETPWTAGERNSGAGLRAGNRLRWTLARRLNRDGRFAEASEFLPPALVPMQERYIALEKARRSGKHQGETRTAIIWEQALMRRHHGAELFSTEAGPDGGARSWSFPMVNLTQARTRQGGWKRDSGNWSEIVSSDRPEHRAVPTVSPDEMIRARRHGVINHIRFHYRYEAADLAWEAGKSLPANHPMLARLYNTAGRWLANSDPEAADRFYQAMVRRCSGTEEGRAADVKRWFPSGLPELDSLPSLPENLRRDPDREAPWY